MKTYLRNNLCNLAEWSALKADMSLPLARTTAGGTHSLVERHWLGE